MKENIEIEVQTRATGKSAVRKLTALKRVAAIIYGPTAEPAAVSMDEATVKKYIRSQYENTIINLKSSDAKLNGKKVFIKSKTVHPLSRRTEHVDFLVIDMNREVRLSVELKFKGTAKGVREGGLMQVVNHKIEIYTLPSNIPEFLEVDVTNLDINESIHANEIELPKGVRHSARAEAITVVTVTVPEVEVVAAPVAAAAAPVAGAPAAGAPAAPGAAPAAGAAAPAAGAPAAKAKK